MQVPGGLANSDSEKAEALADNLESQFQPVPVLPMLPRKAVTFLTKVFNGVLKWQHYPAVWKHARMISLLKPGKDPVLPLSYRPISLLDTVGKFFKKILLSRIMAEINSQGLFRDAVRVLTWAQHDLAADPIS